MESQNNKNMSFSDEERLHARMKSYVGPSILVLFLYLLFYIPGLIANYVYRKEAKQMEHIAGQKLSGTGCLGVMFWLNILNIPLLVLTLVLLIFYAFGKTIYKQFSNKESLEELGKAIAPLLFIFLVMLSIVGTIDAIDYSLMFEALGYAAMGIVSIGLLFFWKKNGWLQPIVENFAKSLSDVWQFINANYKENLPSN